MLYLLDLQSPVNIGMLLRIAEIYQHDVLISDAHKVFQRDDANKTISDFATGALQRIAIHFLSAGDLNDARRLCKGRLIGTDAGRQSCDAMAFDWSHDDCIVLGNEYDGIPDTALAQMDATVRLPMPNGFYPKTQSFSPIDAARNRSVSNDGVPSLNVATAGAALCCITYGFQTGRIRRGPCIAESPGDNS